MRQVLSSELSRVRGADGLYVPPGDEARLIDQAIDDRLRRRRDPGAQLVQFPHRDRRGDHLAQCIMQRRVARQRGPSGKPVDRLVDGDAGGRREHLVVAQARPDPLIARHGP